MLKKCLLILFLVLPGMIFAAPKPFNNIVIFGDSLSDPGNMYALTSKLLPKSPPYFSGDFSDGSVWSQIITEHFKKFNVPSQNYALGGETAVLHLGSGFLPVAIGTSISSYYLLNAFADKSSTLFIIWIGGNDYLNGSTNVASDTDAVVTEIHNQIAGLIANGARSFLVLGLPDLASTPTAKRDGSEIVLHQLAILHNQKLQLDVAALQTRYPEISIRYFDVYNVFNDLIQNPEKFNKQYQTHITNVTDACWNGGYELQKSELQSDLENQLKISAANKKPLHSELEKVNPTISSEILAKYISHSTSLLETYRVGKSFQSGELPCPDQDSYVFWDHVHPSSPVHAIFASMIQDYIDQNFIVAK